MHLAQDILGIIDGSLSKFAELIFTGVAGPISTILKILAIFALLMLAVKNLLQFGATSYSAYILFFVRYILIMMFATVWANFEPIYIVLSEIPDDYGTLILKTVLVSLRTLRKDILDPANVKDIYTGIDAFARAIVWIADDFFRDTAWNDLGKTFKNTFIGIVIMIIGAFFYVASMVIVIVGKVGFNIGITMAPLAISMLLVENTRQYFDAWLRFVIGYAVIPLLCAALLGVVFFMAGEILADSGASSGDKAKFFPFLFIMVAAVALLFQIPTMASSIAGASVAAVGAGAVGGMASWAMRRAGNAKSLAGGAKSLASGAKSMASGGISAAQGAKRWAGSVKNGISAAKEARDAGASKRQAALAGARGTRDGNR